MAWGYYRESEQAQKNEKRTNYFISRRGAENQPRFLLQITAHNCKLATDMRQRRWVAVAMGLLIVVLLPRHQIDQCVAAGPETAHQELEDEAQCSEGDQKSQVNRGND